MLYNGLIVLLLSVVFEEPEDPSSRSFFSEIIASISDVKFSYSGRYILSRDYLTVKVNDLFLCNSLACSHTAYVLLLFVLIKKVLALRLFVFCMCLLSITAPVFTLCARCCCEELEQFYYSNMCLKMYRTIVM